MHIDMVEIPGGMFLMGSDTHYPEEAPARRVRVAPFLMDRCPVTNALFREFVDDTGYVTTAERPVDAAMYPHLRPELLVPASVLFRKPSGSADPRHRAGWWTYVPGADWMHPHGPDSSLKGRWSHPVVHVSFYDALAYAEWANKSLPTEAEWEFAARGGLDGAEFTWGDEYAPDSFMAGPWQGQQRCSGYEWTTPVGAFSSNGYGLYDMAGNVWQWTTDWYQEHAQPVKPCCTISNPRGGPRQDPFESREQRDRPRKVMKGGSFLCAQHDCHRYRPAARMAQDLDMSTFHLGFRCVVRGEHAAI